MKQKKVLSMEIKRDQESCKISLTQKEYLKKVQQKYNINGNMKSIITPFAPHFKLKATLSPSSIEEHESITHVPYASIIDSLIYAIVCTRPNLSQAISMVSKYMHDRGRGHWEEVKWILRYVKGIIDVNLVFKKDSIGKKECAGCVDSDYAGDLDKH